MTNRLMMSVAAAALIAGTGFANAQGTGMGREAPPTGSTVQQSAPPPERVAPSATPMNRDSASDQGMKSTQSDEKSLPPGSKRQKSAQDNMQGQKSKSMSSENDNAKDSAKGGSKEMKAEGRNGNMNADSKTATDSKSQTVGQAGAGAKLSTDQRTRITTVIREQHVAPTANVNFSIAVGTRVPHNVSFHPLPTEVVTVYPEWRGYEFILVGDQIVVINPRTFEIVAVLEA